MTQAPAGSAGAVPVTSRMTASETDFCFLFGRKEPAWETPTLPYDRSESSLPSLPGPRCHLLSWWWVWAGHFSVSSPSVPRLRLPGLSRACCQNHTRTHARTLCIDQCMQGDPLNWQSGRHESILMLEASPGPSRLAQPCQYQGLQGSRLLKKQDFCPGILLGRQGGLTGP